MFYQQNVAERLHVHTTVDLNNLTANIARQVGSEEDANICDILSLTTTTQWNLLHPVLTDFLRQLGCHGSLDETMAVSDGDVVLVPKGHHPCGAPYGYEMYYLNVMAGPIRKWRFKNHPDHDWIYKRDNPST